MKFHMLKTPKISMKMLHKKIINSKEFPRPHTAGDLISFEENKSSELLSQVLTLVFSDNDKDECEISPDEAYFSVNRTRNFVIINPLPL